MVMGSSPMFLLLSLQYKCQISQQSTVVSVFRHQEIYCHQPQWKTQGSWGAVSGKKSIRQEPPQGQGPMLFSGHGTPKSPRFCSVFLPKTPALALNSNAALFPSNYHAPFYPLLNKQSYSVCNFLTPLLGVVYFHLMESVC